jgi:hypothetical protein
MRVGPVAELTQFKAVEEGWERECWPPSSSTQMFPLSMYTLEVREGPARLSLVMVVIMVGGREVLTLLVCHPMVEEVVEDGRVMCAHLRAISHQG